MPNSKLSEAERKLLFRKIAERFQRRDLQFAEAIEEFINAVVNSKEEDPFTPIEVAIFAGQALHFAAEIGAALKPYQHSQDWMEFATQLVVIMLESAQKVRELAREAGVEMNDAEALRDLIKSAESSAEPTKGNEPNTHNSPRSGEKIH